MTSVKHSFLAVCFVVMATIPSLAFYVQPTPQPCATGEACRQVSSRSFINNLVFCCPNGGGLSVNSINNHVNCQCGGGGGTFISNVGNSFYVNGQQMNASQAQPYLNNMRQAFNQHMQQFNANLQAQMAALNTRLSNMGRNMANMFSSW